MRLPRLLCIAAAAAMVLGSASAANAQLQNPGFDTPNPSKPLGALFTQTGPGTSGSAAASWSVSNPATFTSTMHTDTFLTPTTDPTGSAWMLNVVAPGNLAQVFQTFPSMPASNIQSVDIQLASLTPSGTAPAAVRVALFGPSGTVAFQDITTVGPWATVTFVPSATAITQMSFVVLNGAATFRVDNARAQVPEPGSLALLFGGLAPASMLILRRRRR